MIEKIKHALELIEIAVTKYYGRTAVFASFGKDSVVTLHLCRQVKPDIQVVSVMTPYKFKETRHYKEYLTDLWDLNIKTYEAPLLGIDLYKQDGLQCCQYYKVDQVKKAIEELKLDCWISGMRATEGKTRRNVPEWQEDEGLMKLNPILDFTEHEVYLYHIMYGIPINPLYMRGYRSLGCEPCSGIGGKDEREMRFKGTNRVGGECNIHTTGLRSGKCLLKA